VEQFVVFVSGTGHVSACAVQMLFVCCELSFSVFLCSTDSFRFWNAQFLLAMSFCFMAFL
jgi:hypothetical protein